MKRTKVKDLKELKKNIKGITLIALVVTIIVLLILAGVAINLTIGDNGIITRASMAVVYQDNATVLESVKLQLTDYEIGIKAGDISESVSRIEYLKNNNIIDENGIVNVQNLVGQKLTTGNGSGKKDVYIIENNHLYYYNNDEEPRDLGDIGDLGEMLEPTDPSLFEVDDEGEISLKERDEYYNERKEWSIENVVIPSEIDGKKVTTIGYTMFSTFSGNYSFDCIKTIVIPEGVTKIRYFAFNGCVSLTNIELPSSITEIEAYAFRNCRSLTNIDLPSGLTYIGSETFSGCESLTNINIPSMVTTIGSNAFSDCVSLTNIEIPLSVTNIGSSAFSDCTSLTSIEIPSTVTEVGRNTFSGWTSSQTIKVNFKEGELPSGWDKYWNSNCEANIIYAE